MGTVWYCPLGSLCSSLNLWMMKTLTIIRTIGYLAITLGLAIWQGLFVPWFGYFIWGLLMAAWEQPTHHWSVSFAKRMGWDPKFWDAIISWKYAKKIGGYKLDSFHLSKSSSILLLSFVPLSTGGWTWYYALLAAWVTTESFNLFYNYTTTTQHDTSRS